MIADDIEKRKQTMKCKTIIITIVLCLLCCVVGGVWYLQGYENVYYTKIDNTKVQEVSANSDSSDLKYEYTLDCYNKDGKKRNLKFKTFRILKEDAYLLLEVRALGVHKWEEVQYNDLPQKVQEIIN